MKALVVLFATLSGALLGRARPASSGWEGDGTRRGVLRLRQEVCNCDNITLRSSEPLARSSSAVRAVLSSPVCSVDGHTFASLCLALCQGADVDEADVTGEGCTHGITAIRRLTPPPDGRLPAVLSRKGSNMAYLGRIDRTTAPPTQHSAAVFDKRRAARPAGGSYLIRGQSDVYLLDDRTAPLEGAMACRSTSADGDECANANDPQHVTGTFARRQNNTSQQEQACPETSSRRDDDEAALPEHCFDPDDRERVDSTQMPWKAVGLLRLPKLDQGEVVNCTGNIVFGTYVLTNAHCLIDKQDNWIFSPGTGEFCAGYDAEKVFDCVKVLEASVFLPWVFEPSGREEEAAYDFALVKLERNSVDGFDFDIGSFCDEIRPIGAIQGFEFAGYPEDKDTEEVRQAMWRVPPVNQFEPPETSTIFIFPECDEVRRGNGFSRLLHYADIDEGNSGSGMWLDASADDDEGRRVIVALQSGRSRQGTKVNFATEMTPRAIDVIKYWRDVMDEGG
ncbi:unnamed protein product [Vitrella brassicaformis CCMP3155]|uniref:Serine protease n=2 Tax=Vitrella brassicaformis TaxID=1169539 RepID=A0A0G4H826_VITBC|nr:unnamed protein product [Vitrella brassicaformis CCMP3155]|eukprot:CEM39942.1 unnamed protein product [Vitrella brassicaformis CCMP3155]